MSRHARELAAEIDSHDWSDAPYRLDRAGHQRQDDNGSRRTERQLTEAETAKVRTNVMWVVGQVLAHSDPNFDIYEFAEWCGVDTRTSSGRPRSGHIPAGLRFDHDTGQFDRPGGAALPDGESDDVDDPEPDTGPSDRRPDQVGTAEQRARDLWPSDKRTPGFITPRSGNVHQTTDCIKYAHAVSIARRRGRVVHEPVWTTTGEARANGKGICSHCWSETA